MCIRDRYIRTAFSSAIKGTSYAKCNQIVTHCNENVKLFVGNGRETTLVNITFPEKRLKNGKTEEESMRLSRCMSAAFVCIFQGKLWLNRQELWARDFSSNRGIGNGGILCVFPVFDTEEWAEKIRSRPQTIYSEVPKRAGRKAAGGRPPNALFTRCFFLNISAKTTPGDSL